MQHDAQNTRGVRLLQNVDPDLRHAGTRQPYRTRRPEGKIDDPPAHEWPTVIDPYNNGFAAPHIHYPYPGSEWECSVRCRKPLRVELFSARRHPPVFVIGCHADLTRHHVDDHA